MAISGIAVMAIAPIVSVKRISRSPPTAPAAALMEPASAACERVKFSASNTSGVQVARKNTAIELAI